VRQALRKLLGDEVVWFEPKPRPVGYELTAQTRLGPLFNEHGAQESLSRLHPIRIVLV
jgi:hypothetical protein